MLSSCLHTTTQQHPLPPQRALAPLQRGCRQCCKLLLISSSQSSLPPSHPRCSTCSLGLSHNRCKELSSTGQRCCCMLSPGWTNQRQWWGLWAKEDAVKNTEDLQDLHMNTENATDAPGSWESFSSTFPSQQITALWLNLQHTKHQVNNNPLEDCRVFSKSPRWKICAKWD